MDTSEIMDEQRWYFWRVGLVVLISILAFSILTVMFSDVFQSQYTLYIKFAEAPGVTKDTPIRKHGITIGRVREVKMLADGVLLTCGIDSDKPIYKDEICQIKTASFLGDAELAFMNGKLKEGELRELIEADGLVKNVAVAPNPLEIVDVVLDLKENMKSTLMAVTDAGNSIKTTSDNFGQITGLFRDVLKESNEDFTNLLKNGPEFIKNAQRISTKAELAIDNFNTVMGNVNELVGKDELKSSIADSVLKIPGLIENAGATIAELRDTIAPFKTVGGRVDTNLAQLEAFTKSLGEEGPLVISDIRQSVAKVETLIKNIEQFSEQFKNKDGTVGKLFNDPQVYERLNASLANVERITVQVQPLISDFRLFADSLARDPAQLGVKGALQRTSGGGTKGSLLGRNAAGSRSSLGDSGNGQIRSSWFQGHSAVPTEYRTDGYPETGYSETLYPEGGYEVIESPDQTFYQGDSIQHEGMLPWNMPRLFPQLERPVWRPLFSR